VLVAQALFTQEACLQKAEVQVHMEQVAGQAITEEQEDRRKETVFLELEVEDPRTLAAACRLLLLCFMQAPRTIPLHLRCHTALPTRAT
jgi:hypothetical protein